MDKEHCGDSWSGAAKFHNGRFFLRGQGTHTIQENVYVCFPESSELRVGSGRVFTF